MPAQIPPNKEGNLHEARTQRLLLEEGGLDLLGPLPAMPANVPVNIEASPPTPVHSVSAVERARRARAATQRVLAQSDNAKVPA